jgi:hypothetical protein
MKGKTEKVDIPDQQQACVTPVSLLKKETYY